MIAASGEEVENVQGGVEEHHVERLGRFPFDRSLLSALVDQWRPETRTFHLPFGEMTMTLEDVAMLIGLPITGAAIGPFVPPVGWQDEILARFKNILPQEPEGGYVTFPSRVRHGRCFSWLKQFKVPTSSLTFCTTLDML